MACKDDGTMARPIRGRLEDVARTPRQHDARTVSGGCEQGFKHLSASASIRQSSVERLADITAQRSHSTAQPKFQPPLVFSTCQLVWGLAVSG